MFKSFWKVIIGLTSFIKNSDMIIINRSDARNIRQPRPSSSFHPNSLLGPGFSIIQRWLLIVCFDSLVLGIRLENSKYFEVPALAYISCRWILAMPPGFNKCRHGKWGVRSKGNTQIICYIMARPLFSDFVHRHYDCPNVQHNTPHWESSTPYIR